MTAYAPPQTHWLEPDWPAPKGVRAVCTTRVGGACSPPYDSFNLGHHVGDDAAQVRANRTQLQQILGARPVFLDQVHGTTMLELVPNSAEHAQADGSFTQQRGLACTIMVADCLPILLCNTQGTMVGAVHAGWRGLAGHDGRGVLEQICERFRALALVESMPSTIELIAWLGPCIGPDVFEVGPDVRDAFVATQSAAAACFRPLGGGKYLANLPGLARQRLATLGVTRVFGNDGSTPWCTLGNPSRFFSFRRDRVCGRQAACIWLD